jgi:hypothetical protein
MSKLLEMHMRYEAIMAAETSPTERDLALATLMDQIKTEFNVPLLHFAEWEKNNKKVIALYRKVSKSRVTL